MPIQEPSRLIKARSAQSLESATAFNFNDMRRQCDEFVAGARQQGEQILAQAKVEAEELRRRAHAEGLAAGQRDGLASAQQLIEKRASEIAAQQTQDKLRTALPAIQNLVRSLEIERDRWMTHWEAAAVELSRDNRREESCAMNCRAPSWPWGSFKRLCNWRPGSRKSSFACIRPTSTCCTECAEETTFAPGPPRRCRPGPRRNDYPRRLPDRKRATASLMRALRRNWNESPVNCSRGRNV